jgi:hypothetical protein
VTSIGYIEACATPLDRARRATFRWASAFPRLRAILYKRDQRIALQATVGVGVAFALAVISPVAVMSISPALLGVPHLASDVRYLVVRQNLARWWLYALAGCCAALFGLRVVDELVGGNLALGRVELVMAASFVAIAGIAGAARSGAWHRLTIALPLVGALGLIGAANPMMSRVVFAHLHNVVALGLWAFLFRRRLRSALVPIALVGIATAVLLSGATCALTARVGGDAAFGLDLAQVSSWLAPGVAGKLAIGLTLSFIFLQGIHYAVWLGWIPQEELPGQSTMSFKSSLRSLVRDFGVAGFWLVAVVIALVLVGSLVNLHGTRNMYLSLAVFHGYLELAMLCYFVVARRAR